MSESGVFEECVLLLDFLYFVGILLDLSFVSFDGGIEGMYIVFVLKLYIVVIIKIVFVC